MLDLNSENSTQDKITETSNYFGESKNGQLSSELIEADYAQGNYLKYSDIQ